MSIIRAVATVASMLCFLAWLIWFLKKDNREYYQSLARDFLDDDDSTAIIPTSHTVAQQKEIA